MANYDNSKIRDLVLKGKFSLFFFLFLSTLKQWDNEIKYETIHTYIDRYR